MIDFERMRRDNPEAFTEEHIPGFDVKIGKRANVNEPVPVAGELAKLRKGAKPMLAKQDGETELEWQERVRRTFPSVHVRIEGQRHILEVR